MHLIGIERPRFSSWMRRLLLATAALLMLTSSFDVFLVIQAGGNYRLCQVLVAVLFPIALLSVQRFGFIPVLGGSAALLWTAFLIAFIPTSDFLPKSAGYCLWLLLNLATIFSFVEIFGDSTLELRKVVRWYCYSFGLVAAFGIVQFALPVLGYDTPFVAQWWLPGQVPRVNGFSYEPSYFATYLLIGSVLLRSFLHTGSDILGKNTLRALSLVITIALVLSSSRMGIVFLVIDILLYQAAPWLRFVKDLMVGRIRFRVARALLPSLGLAAAATVIVGVGINVARAQPTLVLMFLGGTGISGSTAHSVVQRETAFSDTLRVFQNNPLVGTSLGGVSPAIAALNGATVQSFEDSKSYEGMSVFAEALAASGLIGVLPFVWFLLETVVKPLRLARTAPASDSALLRAMVRSLLFLWAILQFNQNILRPYVWVHLAILATIYARAARATTEKLQKLDVG